MYCYICGVGLAEGNVMYHENMTFFLKMVKKLKKETKEKDYNCGNIDRLNKGFLDDCFELAKKVLSRDEIVELKRGFKLMKGSKKYGWLFKTTLLHKNGKNISIKDSDYYSGHVTDKNGTEYFVDLANNIKPHIKDDYVDGVIVHDDCIKALKVKNFNSLSNQVIRYGFLNSHEYRFQDVMWLRYFEKNVEYVLESPLKNKKNKDRIISLKHNFVMKDIKKLKTDRPSPAESATLFKEGTTKKGNDGNMYVIKKNKNGVHKWVKYLKGGNLKSIVKIKIKYD